MKPGDLVQIRKGVEGRGDIGIVLGPIDDPQWGKGLLKILFNDGIRHVHPSNTQKPDGRTKPRR